MNKYGPSKKELQFRLVVSFAGLSLLAGALVYRGMPQGAAVFETVGIAGVFFGGSFVWTLKKLVRKEFSDEP
ncbi:MAG: hypothetical protein R8G34_16760 [Paracoccaceae bacterium]|nr:hypothetical protein [Paracoccaceae bacterium]